MEVTTIFSDPVYFIVKTTHGNYKIQDNRVYKLIAESWEETSITPEEIICYQT